MGQSTYRDKVYATFGIIAQRIESDTTRRLGFITTAYHIHSLLCHFRREVIKHDTVYATKIKHLLQFIEVTYFNLYLEVFTFFLAIFFSTIDSLVDASGKIHMIVFQQNHVEQSDAMIYTTANLYSHLLKDTHTGSSLTGIGAHAYSYLSVALHIYAS